VTPSNYDPLRFGEVSLGEDGDSRARPEPATKGKGDVLFQDSGSFGEPKSGAVLDNLPGNPPPRHRNPLPPADESEDPGPRWADGAEAETLTQPAVDRQGSPSRHGSASRYGSASQSGRREPLPSKKDHAAYSRMPMPEPAASRVVPMVVLLLGLGAAGYLSIVAQHYPLAIFMALISLVAAPLARMILQGAIE
jgi:hypothetical protein